MGKGGIAKTTLIAFAKLGHLNDASGENFAGLLGVPIGMKSGAGGLQVMPGLFEGVADDANGRRIKRRCVGRNWKRQNSHCALRIALRSVTMKGIAAYFSTLETTPRNGQSNRQTITIPIAG